MSNGKDNDKRSISETDNFKLPCLLTQSLNSQIVLIKAPGKWTCVLFSLF